MVLIFIEQNPSELQNFFKTSPMNLSLGTGFYLDKVLDLWHSALQQDFLIYVPESWGKNSSNPKIQSYKDQELVDVVVDGEVLILTPDMIPQSGFSLFEQLPSGRPHYVYVEGYWSGMIILKGSGPLRELLVDFRYTDGTSAIQIVKPHHILDFSQLSLNDQEAEGQGTDNQIVGKGVVIREGSKVKNCTIYGPCYIDGQSEVSDSTILPYTVIINSKVYNSELLHSYVFNSKVRDITTNSSVLANTISEGLKMEYTLLPSGTRLYGRKK